MSAPALWPPAKPLHVALLRNERHPEPVMQCMPRHARHTPLTALRHGPQLQQVVQPSPQEPRQRGHTHCPLASACAMSSPCRFFRQSLLRGEGEGIRRFDKNQQKG